MTDFDAELLIEAKGLGKSFLLDVPGRTSGGFLKRIFAQRPADENKGRKRFWAVRDVDFEVRRGEAVAIVGRNGAGKSTLLRMIAGVTEPSEGTVNVNGRVAPLLDLSTGFDMEFTGRENIYHAASLVGFSRQEIEARLDAIIAFSELGDFIEQPMKTYSSGMVARLGFAIAANTSADILIVDEALAVGDAAFQQKCMRFIRRFSQTGALLFVSHDTASVTSLCRRALWLDRGFVRAYGEASEVSQHFLAAISEEASGAEGFQTRGERRRPPAEILAHELDPRHAALQASDKRNQLNIFEFEPDSENYGTGGAKIADVALLSSEGLSLSTLSGGENVMLRITAEAKKDLNGVIVGFFFKNRLGQQLFGDNTFLTTLDAPINVAKGGVVQAGFEFRLPYLPPGDYAFDVAIATGSQLDHVIQQWIIDAMFIKVETAHIRHGLIGLPMSRIELIVD